MAVALAAVAAWERSARRPLDVAVVVRVDQWRRDVAPTTTTDEIAPSVLELARDISGAGRAELVLTCEGVRLAHGHP